MEIVIALLILCGSAFAAIAAIGTIRLPDPLSRMHAATKAGSFGAALLLAAAALLYRETAVIIECLLIIGLFYFTAPIAAHLLGKIIASSMRQRCTTNEAPPSNISINQ
ncbi:MAG: monovalent cation/H(+) antiporter subunit G [Verrucomicrobiota bacterium]